MFLIFTSVAGSLRLNNTTIILKLSKIIKIKKIHINLVAFIISQYAN